MAVELVLLLVLLGLVLLGLVLLPLLVLGVSVRTCLVNASQHFPLVVVVVVELGVLVVVEVCAIARPMLPASMAAVITPIPIIRMRYLSCGVVASIRHNLCETAPNRSRS